MCAVAFACLPIFFHGGAIYRWEGVLFLAYYAAYTTWPVLTTGSAWMPTFRTAMVAFVLPITLLTLAVLVSRQIAAERAGRT